MDAPSGPEQAKNDTSPRVGPPRGDAAAIPPAAAEHAPRQTTFAHPSEAEFARILDFYGVRWEYEPRSFPLRWDGDRVLEMFTPDFYLPDLDLYLELTTLRQSLVTEKNRKLRRLRELYPSIKIKLLYKRDYHRILAKYGFGPLAQAQAPGIDRVLITADQLQRRVAELGAQLTRDYAGQRPVFVGVLKGVFCFMADLIRAVSLPLSVEFMSISYYQNAGSHGGVRITRDLERDIRGQHVVMVEDIVDTGMTLNYLLGHLAAREPASLRVCALLDKRVRRIAEVPIHYVGFEVPDEFVVGYGLDYQETYRNLPFIAVLRPEPPPDTSPHAPQDQERRPAPAPPPQEVPPRQQARPAPAGNQRAAKATARKGRTPAGG